MSFSLASEKCRTAFLDAEIYCWHFLVGEACGNNLWRMLLDDYVREEILCFNENRFRVVLVAYAVIDLEINELVDSNFRVIEDK